LRSRFTSLHAAGYSACRLPQPEQDEIIRFNVPRFCTSMRFVSRLVHAKAGQRMFGAKGCLHVSSNR